MSGGESGVIAGAGVVLLAIVLVLRLIRGLSPWLGTWSYDISEAAIVVHLRTLGLRFPAQRVPLGTIARVERTAGPRTGGATYPWRLGRKALLGSGGTADTVDLVRIGWWRAPVVLTPHDPDGFARDARIAVANYRATTRPARAWYTRQS